MPGLAVAQMFPLSSPAGNKRGKGKAALNIREKYLVML